MSDFDAILPGTRVRSDDGIIGTVERLDSTTVATPVTAATPGSVTTPTSGQSQPDSMIVRSEDERWRYRIPLMLVHGVSHETFNSVVQVGVQADDLPRYITEEVAHPTEAMPALTSGEWRPRADETTLRIPLVSEELTATKRAVVRGRLRIHKGVETFPQRETQTVSREEVIVERIPAAQYDTTAPPRPDDTIIPVTAEQLFVEKRIVVKEYIRVRRTLVTTQENVRGSVRREFVEVTEQRQQTASDGNAPLLRDATATTATTATTANTTESARG